MPQRPNGIAWFNGACSNLSLLNIGLPRANRVKMLIGFIMERNCWFHWHITSISNTRKNLLMWHFTNGYCGLNYCFFLPS